MAVNKVIKGNTTLIDLTNDSAVASDVAQGKTFHLADGTQATGTAVPATDRLIPFMNNQLTTLDLTGCSRINTYALFMKSNLTSLNAPDVLQIDNHGMANCNNLTSVSLPSVQKILAWGMCGCAFTTLNLPSIEQIYAAAFYGCTSVTRITLGSSLERIRTNDDGTYAPFCRCNALEELVINATTPPTLQSARLFVDNSSDIGDDMTSFRGIFVPDSSVASYKAATNWSAYSSYIFSQNDL